MSNLIINPILRAVGEELKKAAVNHHHQQQQGQKVEIMPTTKTAVRYKSKQEDIRMNHAEALMKFQLGMLGVILFVIWMILKFN